MFQENVICETSNAHLKSDLKKKKKYIDAMIQ